MEAIVEGRSLYRETLLSKDEVRDLDEGWAASTDADILANAEIYTAVASLPLERTANVAGAMFAIRRMSLEVLNWCRHFQLHEDLRHNRSQITHCAKPSQWTGYCRLIGHRTHIELPADDAVGKFKQRYCNDCDRREPKRP